MQVSTRRFRWESLLLLVIRCLIPVLLALALARPVLTQFRMAGANAETSLWVLLDDSFSMRAPANSDSSLFDVAKKELLRIVQTSGLSEAKVRFSTTGQTRLGENSAVRTNSRSIARQLTLVQPGYGRPAKVALLLDAIRQLKLTNEPNRQLLLASDFQRLDWQAEPDEELDTIRELLAADPFPIRLLMLPVQPSAAASNLSIEMLDSNVHYVRENETFQLTARVRNHGPEEIRTHTWLQVDGQDLSQRQLILPPGDNQLIEFAFKFTEIGWHVARILLDDVSGISGDDVGIHVVHVADQKRALIIDSSDSGQGFSAASRYLQLALAPFHPGAEHVNRWNVRVVNEQALVPSDLQNVDAVVAASMSRLNDDATDAIVKWLKSGGGLVIFASDQLNPEWIHERFQSEDAMLPARFGTLSQDEQGGLRLKTSQQPGELLEVLGSDSAGFAEVRIDRWAELLVSQFADTAEQANASQRMSRVYLELSNGMPLLVGGSFGSGYVVQSAISCSDDWSNLPLKSLYVPLMQSILEMASERAPAMTAVTVGQTVQTSRANPEESIQGNRLAHVINPAGERLVLEMHADAVQFTPDHPGLYRVECENATMDPPLFAAAIDPDESNLDLLAEVELEHLAEKIGAQLVNSTEAFEEQDQLNRRGYEMWRWLVWSVIGLLFVELFVGQRFSRGGP
jgi:hypothetical protein